MAGIGANGSVTTFPNNGEKLCAGCEYWAGERKITQMGTAASSLNGNSAMCKIRKSATFPQQPCLCTPIKYIKWSVLK